MSISSESDEIEGIVERLLDNLARTNSTLGTQAADLRQQIGKMRSRFMAMLMDSTFADELLRCFTLARTANVTLNSLVTVREGLFAEEPEGEIASALVLMAITYCLSAESQMSADLEFTSREDVELVLKRMKAAFDTARELAANSVSSDPSYRTLTFLAGAMTNHLAQVSRPLPRMATFVMPRSIPALALSQRLYFTAERWSEIVDENKIIHPAFPMRQVRVLSR